MSRWSLTALLGGLALTACVPKQGSERVLRLSIWGSIRQAAIEREIAHEFERTHRDVRVEVMAVGSGYDEKLQSMIVGGTAPDLMMVDDLTYADWSKRGALLDITPLMRELNQESPFMPVPWDAFSLNERFYAVPVNCHGIVMYCNLDALRKAGVAFPAQGITWKEFLKIGPKLSRRAGNADAPTDYLCSLQRPAAVLYGFGVQLFDNPHHPTRVTVEGPEAIAAIECLRELYAQHWAASATLTSDTNGYGLFRDGRAAFYFMWRSIVPELMGKTQFQWDVAPVPLNPGGFTEHGGTLVGISPTSREIPLAQEFLKFYCSPASVGIAARSGRVVPVRRALAFGSEFLSLSPPPSIVRFSETMERGASAYPIYTPGARDVSDLCDRRIQQATSEPEIPAAEIVRLLRADLQRWLQRAKAKGLL